MDVSPRIPDQPPLVARKLMTVKETANLLRVHPLTVYQYLKTSNRKWRLRSIRLSGRNSIRILYDDLIAWLELNRR